MEETNITDLKYVTKETLKENEASVVHNLKLLLSGSPEKIIDLYNLENEHINELLRRELNLDLDLAIEASFKTVHNKRHEDIIAFAYIIHYLSKENQLIYKRILEKKMRENGIYFHISLIQTAEKFFGRSCDDWFESNGEKKSESGIIFSTK